MFDATSVIAQSGPSVPIDGSAWLPARLGGEGAARRLALQARFDAEGVRREAGRLTSPWALLDLAVPRVLGATGLLGRGRRNAARIEVIRNEVEMPGLPEAFRGFTILHLTDFHADISPGAMAALPRVIDGLAFDACVITGDFRGRTWGPFGRAVALVRKALREVRQPIYGVLGNHDPGEIGAFLEAIGIRMLMNEAEAVVRGRERLWIAGVDDPHRFRTHDIAKALAAVRPGEPTVLLAHATECVAEAEAAAIGLMLCGHTHGGQICLPGSVPLLTASPMPRRLARGPWRHGNLQGYTSRGIGTSGVEARYNCAPEVTLHRLVPARRA